jgi:hypothetical protein
MTGARSFDIALIVTLFSYLHHVSCLKWEYQWLAFGKCLVRVSAGAFGGFRRLFDAGVGIIAEIRTLRFPSKGHAVTQLVEALVYKC